MPYFRAHLAGRVDEAVLREMTDDSGDALSDATANANANTGTAATRPRGTREAPPSRMRDGTKRRSTSARGETADESQSGKKKKNVRRVELTVHCDVEIFARLLAHVDETQKDASLKKTGSDIPDIPNPEALTVRDCVPVLVASEFLGMRALAESCLASLASGSPEALALRPGRASRTSATRRWPASRRSSRRRHSSARSRSFDGATERRRRLSPSRRFRRVCTRSSCVRRTSEPAREPARRKPKPSGTLGTGTHPDRKQKQSVCRAACRARACSRQTPFLFCRARARRRASRSTGASSRERPAPRFDAAAFLDVLLEAHDPGRLLVPVGSDARPTGVQRCGRGRRGGELDACRYHPRETVFDVRERDEGEESDFHEAAATAAAMGHRGPAG